MTKMNQDGCPPGRFTDDILAFGSLPHSCEGHVNGWIASMIVIVSIRLAVLIAIWVVWFRRRRRLQQALEMAANSTPGSTANKNGRHFVSRATEAASHRKFPLIPFISTVDTIIIMLFFVLTTTNSISITNAGSILLIAYWVLVFNTIQLLALRKLVRLGTRVFKFGEQRFAASSVSRFDRVLKILMSLMLLLIWSACILATIIIATNDPITKPLLTRIGLAFITAQQILWHISLIHQYDRVIRCVAEAHNQVGLESFRRAMDGLRYNQVVIGLTAFPIVGLFMYFTITLAYFFWLIPLTMFLDCFLYGSMIMREIRVSCAPRESEDNKNQSQLSSGGNAPLYLRLQQSSPQNTNSVNRKLIEAMLPKHATPPQQQQSGAGVVALDIDHDEDERAGE